MKKKSPLRPRPSQPVQLLRPIADAALRDVTGGQRDVVTGQSSGKRQHEDIKY